MHPCFPTHTLNFATMMIFGVLEPTLRREGIILTTLITGLVWLLVCHYLKYILVAATFTVFLAELL